MGFHHVALATRDTEATHRFYTEVGGFELVEVEFCHTTRPFTPDERRRALELLHDPRPPLEKEFGATIHRPIDAASIPEPVAGG